MDFEEQVRRALEDSIKQTWDNLNPLHKEEVEVHIEEAELLVKALDDFLIKKLLPRLTRLEENAKRSQLSPEHLAALQSIQTRLASIAEVLSEDAI